MIGAPRAASVLLPAAVVLSALTPGRALAGDEDVEHTVVVGVGGAVDAELSGGAVHSGANFMVEWDAVEGWLELELEASLLSADGGIEVPVGLLVKKPFRLARTVEMMVGVGPEIVRTVGPSARGTYFGGEVALDFMFWPWGRTAGLWIEPAYDVLLRDGASHGLGATGGLLLGW